jgi:hypothetical protein
MRQLAGKEASILGQEGIRTTRILTTVMRTTDFLHEKDNRTSKVEAALEEFAYLYFSYTYPQRV